MIKTLNKKNILTLKIVKTNLISLDEKLKKSQDSMLKGNFKNFDNTFLNKFYQDAKKRNLIKS
ncbi:MAG: hypothetical protein Q9M94_05580 [Candidatus Gracilibacteria bacterium]|nr:hypothetical protein [Candidatus Gracilibacteria bacterium]